MATRKSSPRKKPTDDREAALIEKESRLIADEFHPQPELTGLNAVLDECESIAPGVMGQLVWISNRCELAGLNTINDLWMTIFLDYFESKKPIFLIFAGLRGGKTSNLLRALILVAFFRQHRVQRGSTATIPIMSATPQLAQQTLIELLALLHAIGISPPREDENAIVQPGGFGGTYRKTLVSGGGGKIEVLTAHGYTIQFLCNSITARHVMGFTCVGGLCDELDGWQEGGQYKNPATEVRDGLIHRINTTRETACLFFASAWYPRVEAKTRTRSCHRLMMEAGPTDSIHIARLGELGAAEDERLRREFANLTGKDDPRLLAKGDPNATGIPAWVINPTRTTVDSCYQSSGEDFHRMFAEYGAQYSKESVNTGGFLAQAEWCVKVNGPVRVTAPATLDGGQSSAGMGLLKFPGVRRDDPRYGGPRRNDRGPSF